MFVPILLQTLFRDILQAQVHFYPDWVAPLILPHGFKMVQNLFSPRNQKLSTMRPDAGPKVTRVVNSWLQRRQPYSDFTWVGWSKVNLAFANHQFDRDGTARDCLLSRFGKVHWPVAKQPDAWKARAQV